MSWERYWTVVKKLKKEKFVPTSKHKPEAYRGRGGNHSCVDWIEMSSKIQNCNSGEHFSGCGNGLTEGSIPAFSWSDQVYQIQTIPSTHTHT